MERAQRAATRSSSRSGAERKPFGLAAFTSLSRPGAPLEAPPDHPME
jgi:hypothetical protein